MKKCILLVRVSTKVQDLDQQREKVLERAVKDGYLEENCIILEDKESAVKLSEEERNGLNRMKENIENDPSINAVYCYEISRISRRPEVLYSVRDYLLERKINLICLSPDFKILKEDDKGDLIFDTNSNIYFGLFTVFAENEGFNRKDRFLRGKLNSIKQNKYVGGELNYGYKVLQDKTIVINEDQAKNIRKAYDMLLSEKYSVSSIAKEFISLGIFSGSQRTIVNKLARIFHSKDYTGEKGKRYSLPMIITPEEYEKAQVIIEKNKVGLKNSVKRIYYAKHIIFDKKSGFRMVGLTSCKSYYCHNTRSQVSINIIDSLLWYYVINTIETMKKKGIKNLNEDPEREKKIKDLETKIKVAEEKISGIVPKIDQISERIILGRLSEAKGDELIDKLLEEKKDLEKSVQKWTIQKNDLTNVSDSESTNSPLPTTDEGKRDLIYSMVERIDYQKFNKYSIQVDLYRKYTGFRTSYRLNPYTFKIQKQEDNYDESEWVDLDGVEKLNRFK